MLFCVVDITIGGPAATAQDFGIIDRLVFKVSGITLSSALELYCTVILKPNGVQVIFSLKFLEGERNFFLCHLRILYSLQ